MDIMNIETYHIPEKRGNKKITYYFRYETLDILIAKVKKQQQHPAQPAHKVKTTLVQRLFNVVPYNVVSTSCASWKYSQINQKKSKQFDKNNVVIPDAGL